MDRKEFMKMVGRAMLLGSFGVFSGYLIANKRITKASACTVNKKCSNCCKYPACDLPQA